MVSEGISNIHQATVARDVRLPLLRAARTQAKENPATLCSDAIQVSRRPDSLALTEMLAYPFAVVLVTKLPYTVANTPGLQGRDSTESVTLGLTPSQTLLLTVSRRA